MINKNHVSIRGACYSCYTRDDISLDYFVRYPIEGNEPSPSGDVTLNTKRQKNDEKGTAVGLVTNFSIPVTNPVNFPLIIFFRAGDKYPLVIDLSDDAKKEYYAQAVRIGREKI